MQRLYWNLRTGLAGGFFLAADNCPYILSLYQTRRGERCDILSACDFTPMHTKLKINYAKRKVKEIIKQE